MLFVFLLALYAVDAVPSASNSQSQSLLPNPPPSCFLSGFTDQPGNVLIADTGNNRVVEILVPDPDWDEAINIGDNSEGDENEITLNYATFCDGSNPQQLGRPYNDYGCDYSRTDNMFGPVWAQRLGCGLTLVVSAGRPYCPDNRILLFNSSGTGYFWQYGSNLPGSGPGQLNGPSHAAFTYMDFDTTHNQPDTHNWRICETNPEYPWLDDIIITDSGNNRILVVDWCTKQIEWSFGPTTGHLKLNNPTMTQVLSSGNLLITDSGNRRVLEIDKHKNLVAEYRNASLALPTFASRIDWSWVNNINTESDIIGTELITDIEADVAVQLDIKGRVNKLISGNIFDPPAELELVHAIRVRDRNHYLMTFIAPFWWGHSEGDGYVLAWSRYRDEYKFIIGEEWSYIVLNNPSSSTLVGDYTGLTVPPYFVDYSYQYCGHIMRENYVDFGNICGRPVETRRRC